MAVARSSALTDSASAALAVRSSAACRAFACVASRVRERDPGLLCEHPEEELIAFGRLGVGGHGKEAELALHPRSGNAQPHASP